jgi:hypothetical protein
MPTDWQRLYEAALHENDPTKVAEACERARRAINEQELALARDEAHLGIREELAEALRQLVLHEYAVKQHKP